MVFDQRTSSFVVRARSKMGQLSLMQATDCVTTSGLQKRPTAATCTFSSVRACTGMEQGRKQREREAGRTDTERDGERQSGRDNPSLLPAEREGERARERWSGRGSIAE